MSKIVELGVDIGSLGSPHAPILKAFSEMGVALKDGTISKLRSPQGRHTATGRDLLERLLCERNLTEGKTILKDRYYLKATEWGLRLRSPQKFRSRTHRFRSPELTNDIAGKLNVSEIDLRLSLRAMRIDLVCMERDDTLPNLVRQTFMETAEVFIEAYTGPRNCPSIISQPIKELGERWDHKTAESFYTSMYSYSQRVGGTIGAFTPHEIEGLNSLYLHQMVEHKLTPFDKLVLESFAKGVSAEELADSLDTPVDVTFRVVTAHRNALLYGRPTRVV